MIELNEKGKLKVSYLSIGKPLDQSIIKGYDSKKVQKDINKIFKQLENNYFYHIAYQEFLKYSIEENLELVIVEDPNFNVKSYSNDIPLTNDTTFRYFNEEDYKASYILCEYLLRRVKDSYNSLSEAEKFIIKNFEYDFRKEYIDVALGEELGLSHDPYYILKKSAYLKMALQLGLTIEEDTDNILRAKLIESVEDGIINEIKIPE